MAGADRYWQVRRGAKGWFGSIILRQMATLDAPPTSNDSDATPEGEYPPVEGMTAPPPEVIRVPSRRLSGPVAYAAVGVPLLIASFVGSMFAARGAAAPAPAHSAHWSYEGADGPAQWGAIDPHNIACQTGGEQSPIDITPSRLMQVDWLTPITLRYKPAKQLRLVNNGHTYQVNYERGSRMTFLGQEYELVQFHFHTPSEHTVNGRAADMELQLVHAMPDAPSRLAILGILIVEGRENAALAKFWEQMPQKETKDPVPLNVELNPQDFIPQNTRYYAYNGSLTTPPCTQGVQWVVLKEAITASRAQIQKFKDVFKMNARPVQPVKDRFIMEEAAPTR